MNGRQDLVFNDGGSPNVIVVKTSYMSMRNYNYIVVSPHSRNAVVVDPAWEIEKIERKIEKAQGTLKGILVTHSHPDHIHLAKPLAEKYDCAIYMSRQEVIVSGFESEHLVSIDGSTLVVGDITIGAMHTPGHTPGCICYYIGGNLFTGDVLFAEGCGLCPSVQAAHTMFESLEYLKSRLPRETRIYPGHSYGKLPGQPFYKLLKENIYLQFSNKYDFANFRLRPGQRPRLFG